MDNFESLMNRVLLDRSDQKAVDELVRYFIIHNMMMKSADFDKVIYDSLSTDNFKSLHHLAKVYLKYKEEFERAVESTNTEEATRLNSTSIVFSEVGKLQIRKTIEEHVLNNASDELKKIINDKFLEILEEERRNGSTKTP